MTTSSPAPVAPKTPPPPQPPNKNGGRKFGTVAAAAGHRVLLYGAAGAHKTSIACAAPGTVAVWDGENSLAVLRDKFTACGVKSPLVLRAADFQELRAELNSGGWETIRTLVIDSGTVLEQWIAAQVCRGKGVSSLEDIPYGKGYSLAHDEWCKVLVDLERHTREGRNVILVAHDCSAKIANPAGADFLRFEPRLMHTSEGKNSNRYRAKEWADHVVFASYDVNTKEGGKAEGKGTVTLRTTEQPWYLAKSRTCARGGMPLQMNDFGAIWRELGIG